MEATNHLKHIWQKTYRAMQRIKPHLEQKARSSKGRYRANLAHEWRVFLVEQIPLT